MRPIRPILVNRSLLAQSKIDFDIFFCIASREVTRIFHSSVNSWKGLFEPLWVLLLELKAGTSLRISGFQALVLKISVFLETKVLCKGLIKLFNFFNWDPGTAFIKLRSLWLS